MNILHIISAPASGGAEVYVKDLAKFMSSAGHNVHIAFVGHASDIGRSQDYENNFIRELEQSGVKTYVIGNSCRKKPWLGAYRVNRYVKTRKIDIIHTHLAYAIAFSTLAQVPTIYTHHQADPRWNKLLYKLFNQFIDEYIGISNICSDLLSNATGRRINTIFNAVNENKFANYQRERFFQSHIDIAMVGRLDPQKDYPNLLYALSLLPKNIISKLKVRIAGEGDCEQQILSLIDSMHLNNTVELSGVVTNIPEFLYNSDLFLMSSKYEGLPIALLEATISGLPSIVTDVGGCSEVIEQSQNGIIVPPNNPKALANAIEKFFTNRKLLNQLSINSLNNCSQYSIAYSAKHHIELYEKLL